MPEHDTQPTAEEREAQLAAREAALAAREAELAEREAEAAQASAPQKGSLLNNGDPHFKNEKEKIYDHFPLRKDLRPLPPQRPPDGHPDRGAGGADRDLCLFGGQPDQLFRSVLNNKKVPFSRHVRMNGTQPGKFGAESVRAALRRVRGSAPNFVQKGQRQRSASCGRNSELTLAQRSGFRKRQRAAKIGQAQERQGERISVPRMRAEMGSPWRLKSGPAPEWPGSAPAARTADTA